MNDTQKALLELAKKTDLSTMSLGEIARQVGAVYPQNAKHHLLQLEKKGLLPYPFRSRSKTAESIKVQRIPLVGAANCGPATVFADENVEAYLEVSPNLLPTRKKDLFALKAVGESMNDARAGLINPKPINDGDYVVVESKSYKPNNGDYIVSIIDGAANIKQFKKVGPDEVTLVSQSTLDYKPIYLHADDDFAICGEVIQVLSAQELKKQK